MHAIGRLAAPASWPYSLLLFLCLLTCVSPVSGSNTSCPRIFALQGHSLIIHTFRRSARKKCLWRPHQLVLNCQVSPCPSSCGMNCQQQPVVSKE